MAYCIHCGVELEQSLRACPLCGTPLPQTYWNEQAEPLYPPQTELFAPPHPRAACVLLGALLACGMVICALVNILFTPAQRWAVLPVGILAVCEVALLPPLWARRLRVTHIGLDFIALSALLALLSYMSGGGWFMPVVFPALAMGTLLVCALFALIRSARVYKLDGLSVGFIFAGLECVWIELLAGRMQGAAGLSWSLVVLAGCAVLAAVAAWYMHGLRNSQTFLKKFHR